MAAGKAPIVRSACPNGTINLVICFNRGQKHVFPSIRQAGATSQVWNEMVSCWPPPTSPSNKTFQYTSSALLKRWTMMHQELWRYSNKRFPKSVINSFKGMFSYRVFLITTISFPQYYWPPFQDIHKFSPWMLFAFILKHFLLFLAGSLCLKFRIKEFNLNRQQTCIRLYRPTSDIPPNGKYQQREIFHIL